ncbi:glycerol kinase GlpK [Gimibacter soli]|uniref:glycerol kinase n=1 Tax=Gimibacter soli TaxID=3024400 RepID=A0AAE9XSK9_9PROT|nr:glycerol kinase GlpK [Gimibacter soli]WCL55597.1 glycerol kinase GlpK [Gimibacter soli]
MTRGTVVAIDQGTTSTRAIRMDGFGHIQHKSTRDLACMYPHAAWVEQDPEDIWQSALAVLSDVVQDDTLAIGIANQRETIVVWDRKTGVPIYNAIVWQDRRTAALCLSLVNEGAEAGVRSKTGLLIDPYFSASKLAWILDHVAGARERAARGELAAGTIDSFLLWRLTGGTVHATDATNAARTMLYDITTHSWDMDLLHLFDIPAALLPSVRDNCHLFGETSPEVLARRLPITGMAGDQQAAMIGQCCFARGTIKSTYGTGCFMLANVGASPVISKARLLSTPIYKIGAEKAYAIEGSIFSAGATISWLRDRLGLISSAADTEALAAEAPADHGIHLIPAFVGLGAPYWRPDARASIIGLTFDTDRATLVRAALEAVAFQTTDLLSAMMDDSLANVGSVRIDGGVSTNNWFAQFLSNMLNMDVERPEDHDSTAIGAAFLAGLTIGLWSGFADLEAMWHRSASFSPQLSPDERQARLAGWNLAVRQTLTTPVGALSAA